jgi:hypothetical protein
VTIRPVARRTSPAVPPGWTANPSSWRQRVPLVALAAIGFAIAAYLASFQWGLVPDVWEPFFGHGSRIILTSGVSRLLPVPDAALGALAYLLDAVTGLIGGRARWRTMPWIVVLFGVAVGPLGAVSIVLVILQPVVYDAWCTLCLGSAAISVLMIGPALDEVLASLQHLRRVCDAGGSVARAFWRGTRPSGAGAPAPRARGTRWSMWPDLVAAALGIWLMASPAVLSYGGAAGAADRIAGPVVASVALIAAAEAVRGAFAG